MENLNPTTQTMVQNIRRLDWLLPSWLEDAGAYDQSIDEDMVTIGYTVVVNVIILFLCVLFFSVYRRYDTHIFAPKCNLMPDRCPLKLSSKRLFGWMTELFYIDDEAVIEKGGYDVLFFLRFYRLAYKIFSVFAIYAWGILLPVNATGRGIVDNNNTFELWSMTNLKQGSDRCWFHLVGIYLLTLITIYFLEKEFVVYAKYRHAYLRQRHAHLRTVLVEGIPNKMRSTITLATYFETLYPNAVLSVRLGQDLQYLDRLVTQRLTALTLLERCMYANHLGYRRPTVRVGNMAEEVDAARYYYHMLNDLNAAVAKEQEGANARSLFVDKHSGTDAFAIIEGFLQVTEIGSLKKLLKKRAASGSNSKWIMKSSKDSNGASSSNRFNDSQHNRFNDSQHSTQSSMLVSVDVRGRLDVRQRGRDMNLGKHDSSHVAMPIGNNATVTQMGRDASGGEVDMIAGDFDEVHSYQSGGMVSGLGRVNGHDNYRGNNGGNGSMGSNSQKLTSKGGKVNEASVNEAYLADSYQSSSSNNQANQESEGLLSNAENGGNGSNNNGMCPGVSPLNVYKMSRKEWLWAMWQAPTWWDSWRLLKDGRHQVDHTKPDTSYVISPPEERRMFLSKAFITFRTFQAATIARQVVHMQLAGHMAISEAPEPTDVTWINMYTTRTGQLYRRFLVEAIVLFLIVIWVAPVTLISFVVSEDSLRSHFPFIDSWCNHSVLFQSLIELLQPGALVGIMNLLPPILTGLAIMEGCISFSKNQFRSFDRYFTFQVINVFLVTTIAGSVIDCLKEIYEDPKSAFSLLGDSLPRMGAFFTNYLIMKAFTGLGIEIIRLPAMFSSILKFLFTSNLTPRDRKYPYLFGSVRSMSNPGWFPFAKIYAQDTLLVVVCATYACIAPLSLVAGLCYFAGASFVYKHQMLYVYEPIYETGGKWWPKIARCIVVALLFAQSTMVGMMILKGTYMEIYFLGMIFLSTLVYFWYIAKTYEPLASQLPFDMATALDLDQQNDPDELAGAEEYIQPSLRAGIVHPEVEFAIGGHSHGLGKETGSNSGMVGGGGVDSSVPLSAMHVVIDGENTVVL